MNKKILIGIAVCTLMLSGCNKKQDSFLDENGEPIIYTNQTVPLENYYIKKEDGTYRRLLNIGVNEKQKDSSYIWLAGNYEKNIPRFSKGDSLIFFSKKKLPGDLELIKMSDQGFSIGIKFSPPKEDGSTFQIKFPTSESAYCDSSVVRSVIESSVNPSANMVSINDIPFKNSMFSNFGIIKGLEKRAMYKIGYYEGTVYNTINLMSDTRIFEEEGRLPITSMESFDNVFLKINLPENMDDGFYLLSGVGFFQYTGSSNSAIIDQIENIPESIPEYTSGPAPESGETYDTGYGENDSLGEPITVIDENEPLPDPQYNPVEEMPEELSLD